MSDLGPSPTQEQTAAWMGYSVAEMNRDHDDLHKALCAFLGIPSHSMMEARGEPLTPEQQELAWWEEAAVLYVQRLMARSGVHDAWRRA